jgi:hypothetical protein
MGEGQGEGARGSILEIMRGNYLLSILALGLTVLAFAERRATLPPASAELEVTRDPLFALRLEETSAIRVVDRNGCVFVRKEAVTSQPASALMDSVSRAHVIRRFPPAEADFSPYGLVRPTRRVEVIGGDGERRQVVNIGELNPVRNAVYARIQDDPDVLLVGSYFLTSLDMALQELRAHSPVAADLKCPEGPESVKHPWRWVW